MDEEYWSVKRNAYSVVCITPDFHGTTTVWDTSEEAWQDIIERIDDFMDDESIDTYCYVSKVYDGYEIRDKYDNRIICCYKVFETQELE